MRTYHNPIVGRFRIKLKNFAAKIKLVIMKISRVRDPTIKENVT